MQDSLPAGWLAFAGRELNPLDRYERFPSCYISSPFSEFILTLDGREHDGTLSRNGNARSQSSPLPINCCARKHIKIRDPAQELHFDDDGKRLRVLTVLEKVRSTPVRYVHGSVVRSDDGIFIVQSNCHPTCALSSLKS